MVNEQQDKILTRAINEYGEDSQIEMMVEECSELILAIQKLKRAEQKRLKKECNDADAITARHNIRQELADVEILIHQMKKVFGKELIQDQIDFKIDRLERRLNAKNAG